MHTDKYSKVEELYGKVLTKFNVDKLRDVIEIECTDGTSYQMYHEPDCCESVTIDDINGRIEDLIGSPITLAEESSNSENPKYENEDSWTWTFYKFATIKGYVDIKWYGTSNGYYSEEVSFIKQ